MATGPFKRGLSGTRPAAGSLYALRVGVVGRADIPQVVGAELLEGRLGEHDRRGHRTGVGPLLEGPGRLPAGEVDGAQGLRYGGDRLHRRRYYDGLAVGHAALDATEAVACARGGAAGCRARQDLVLHL